MENLFFNGYNLISSDCSNPNLYFELNKNESDINVKFLSSSIDKNLISKKVNIIFTEEMGQKIYSKIDELIEKTCCGKFEFSLIKTNVTKSTSEHVYMSCDNIVIRNGSFVSPILAN